MIPYLYNDFIMNQPMFGDSARAETARLLFLSGADEADVSNLMNYEPWDGTGRRTAKSQKPVTMFIGKKDGFRLAGLGEEGVSSIRTLARTLAGAWSIRLGRPVIQNLSEGTMDATVTPYTIRYAIRRMVIQKKQGQKLAIASDAAGHIERMIARSIKGQADRLNIDLGEKREDIKVSVVSTKDLSPVKISDYCAGFGMSKEIVFDANVRLDGPWFTGHFAARGYGVIKPYSVVQLVRNNRLMEVDHNTDLSDAPHTFEPLLSEATS